MRLASLSRVSALALLASACGCTASEATSAAQKAAVKLEAVRFAKFQSGGSAEIERLMVGIKASMIQSGRMSAGATQFEAANPGFVDYASDAVVTAVRPSITKEYESFDASVAERAAEFFNLHELIEINSAFDSDVVKRLQIASRRTSRPWPTSSEGSLIEMSGNSLNAYIHDEPATARLLSPADQAYIAKFNNSPSGRRFALFLPQLTEWQASSTKRTWNMIKPVVPQVMRSATAEFMNRSQVK